MGDSSPLPMSDGVNVTYMVEINVDTAADLEKLAGHYGITTEGLIRQAIALACGPDHVKELAGQVFLTHLTTGNITFQR